MLPRDQGLCNEPQSVLLAGERVELFAERALYWPRERSLFVADVHLGKAAAFRAGGVPLPGGTTAGDLERLTRLVAATGARRLVVLGDFLHAAAGRTLALEQAFVAWRDRHAALAITLVRGNHDAKAGDPPAHWRIEVVAEPYPAPPFLLCHEPPRASAGGLFGYALAGHVHPGVHIAGAGLQSERLPCFVLGPWRAILPAFGRFTGLATQSWSNGDRVIAIAGERLFALPPHAAAT
jgi:DNA ligase-associated metallophosphoesterase